jgi:hypothetical protein
MRIPVYPRILTAPDPNRELALYPPYALYTCAFAEDPGQAECQLDRAWSCP